MIQADELVKMLQSGTHSPEEKAEIGRQLAVMGDPRPGVGLNADRMPNIDWVNVPAGDFLMGCTMGDLTATMNEIPQNRVTLPTFYISRYPITYAQFEVFVRDDGYSNRAYWTQAGNTWCGGGATQPQRGGFFSRLFGRGSAPSSAARKVEPGQFWGDPQFHLSNHPVVGVTWYEAAAFCAWLSYKTQMRVWLPSEAQWEKAARGTDGRRFPWGNQFYAQYANCGQTVQVDRYNRDQEMIGIGQTTVVGMYLDGASPYGVLDMCGNVWEWTSSNWRDDYEEPENNDLEGDDDRVVRGGSWKEREINGRTTARMAAAPDAAFNNVGFRICAGR